MNYEKMSKEELKSCLEQLRGLYNSTNHPAMKKEYLDRITRIRMLIKSK